MVKVIAKFPKEVNETINENVISTQVTEFYPHYLFGNAASDIQFLKIFTFGNLIKLRKYRHKNNTFNFRLSVLFFVYNF